MSGHATVSRPRQAYISFRETLKQPLSGIMTANEDFWAYDGRLWAAANSPRGANFYFTLPLTHRYRNDDHR